MPEAKRDEVPLPEPIDIVGIVCGDDKSPTYRFTADQLREHGRQCAQAERERCAKVCEGHGTGGFSYAAAIRSQNLIKE